MKLNRLPLKPLQKLTWNHLHHFTPISSISEETHAPQPFKINYPGILLYFYPKYLTSRYFILFHFNTL